MVIVSELFKKHIQQTNKGSLLTKFERNVRKEDRIIDALEPVLNQHRLVLTVGLLTGITAQTKTVHLRVGSSICSFTR